MTGTATRTSERVIGLRMGQQELCTCITLFCTFLCHHCTTTTSKCLVQHFMENANKRRGVFPSLSKLECSRQEINFSKFAYISHCQRIGINATKIKKKKHRFSLNLTFSLPSPSSMLKIPIITLLRKTDE